MNATDLDLVALYKGFTDRGIPEQAAATLVAALVVVRELDIISDMLDGIDSRLLMAGNDLDGDQ